MKNQIPALAQFRIRANIDIQCLSSLLNTRHENLTLIERGLKTPSVTILLAYHILFDAPLLELFPDEYADLYAQVCERSSTLIANLKQKQTPNSILKLQRVKRIVNKFNRSSYE